MTEDADQLYEQLLILRCQTGDGNALKELMERYGARVQYYVRRLLGDADRAEDVLQEVWFDVFRALPRLADAQAFRAWLYRIARDRAFRELRKRRLLGRSLEESDLCQEADEEESFTAEDAQRIHEALHALPPEQRDVLVLKYLEEMSYEEIARVVGCQLGTVRSRLHYAKRALRREMERNER